MVLCPVVKATLKEVINLENTERGSGGSVLQELNN